MDLNNAVMGERSLSPTVFVASDKVITVESPKPLARVENCRWPGNLGAEPVQACVAPTDTISMLHTRDTTGPPRHDVA